MKVPGFAGELLLPTWARVLMVESVPNGIAIHRHEFKLAGGEHQFILGGLPI